MNISQRADAPIPCNALIQGAIFQPSGGSNPWSEPNLLSDGALCVDQDRIVAIGEFAELRERYIPANHYGSSGHLILPGFVNGHDHVRAPSSVELGISDDLLEVWILDLMRLPGLDPELVSTLAHCQMLESGVTTVVNSFYQPTAKLYDETLSATLIGADRSQARAVVALSNMDDSIIGSLLDKVRPRLPNDLRNQTEQFLGSRRAMSMPEYEQLVRSWTAQTNFDRASFLVGPVSVHWCSDAILENIWDLSASLGLSIQTHLLESVYQRDTANHRYGRSIVSFMDDAGLLNERLSCAHCVFTTQADMELFAEKNVSIIHCPGSNMRLQNGVAPLRDMLKNGINVGLGADSMAVGDDGDILKEIQFAHTLHTDELSGAPLVSRSTLLSMATLNSAHAIGMGNQTGSLEPGKKADISVYKPQPCNERRHKLPSIDSLFDSEPAYRVDQVFVDGQLVVQDGRHTKTDRDQLHAELLQAAEKTLRDNESFGEFVQALTPFIRQYVNNKR